MTQTAEIPAHELRGRALDHYRAELDEGRDPSARELAELFDRTDRWARGIRSEVQAEREASTGTAAPVPDLAPESPAEHTPETGTVDAEELAPPADVEPAAETPAETPAETGPVPAPMDPHTPDPAPETDEADENPSRLAQNPAHDAPTVDPRPSGHPEGPSLTEPHTAAPSWTVQESTATLAPETPRNGERVIPVPLTVPAATPETPAETPARSAVAEQPATTVTETPAESPTAKPERKRIGTWPVWLVALGAFVSIWSGWVGLGEMTGFGVVHPLPGIADGFKINTAITLPIGVEAYAAFALRVWLSGRGTAKAVQFARASAIGALALGAFGQVTYHLLSAAGKTSAPWQITTAVACLPVAVLGMAAALAHLVRADDAGAR